MSSVQYTGPSQLQEAQIMLDMNVWILRNFIQNLGTETIQSTHAYH